MHTFWANIFLRYIANLARKPWEMFFSKGSVVQILLRYMGSSLKYIANGKPWELFYSSLFQIQLRCSVHLSMKWIFKNAQRETPPRYCSQSTRLRSQQVSTSLRSTRLYKSLQVLRLCKSLLHKKVSVCALRIFPHHVNCLQSRRLHLCTQICGKTVNIACQIWFCKKLRK